MLCSVEDDVSNASTASCIVEYDPSPPTTSAPDGALVLLPAATTATQLPAATTAAQLRVDRKIFMGLMTAFSESRENNDDLTISINTST